MAFTALTTAQTDADSPLDATLFGTIKSDFDDHEARLASVEVNGPPNGTVTPLKFGTGGAGDALWTYADTEVNPFYQYPSYAKRKEILVSRAGLVRVRFDLKSNLGGAYTIFGRIYVNGVAVGTERTTNSTTYVTYSEDITVANGDLVQLYLKTSTGGDTAYRNFRLSLVNYDHPVVNLDT